MDTATTEIYTYCHTLSLHDARPLSPAARRPSSARVPGGRWGLASSPAGRSVRIVRAGRGDLLQQQLVDARAVAVDAPDPPAAPLAMLSDLGDTAELGDAYSHGGVGFSPHPPRPHTVTDQFAQVVY